MFYRIDNTFVHKTSLRKFKKTEIISNIFSRYNGMKPEMDHKKNIGKATKIQKLDNVLPKKTGSSKKDFTNTFETNENRNTKYQKL